MFAKPITLNFIVHFDEDARTLRRRITHRSSCTATFYPTLDNPFYYGESTSTAPSTIAQNTTRVRTETQYFEATYPYPGNDNYGKSAVFRR